MRIQEEDTPAGGSGKDQEVQKSEDLFMVYRDAQSSWSERALINDAFANGNQWLQADIDELKERGESPVKHNVTGAAIKAKIALLTANSPSYQAAAEEDSDVGMGRVFSNILSYIWRRSNGNQQLKIGLKHYCQRGGRVIQHVFFDPTADFGKGEVCYKIIDPLKVYPDPNSADPLFRDAAHVLYSDTITWDQIKRFYPQYASKVKEEGVPTSFDENNLHAAYTDERPVQLGKQIKEVYHTKYRLIQRQTRIMAKFQRVFDPTSGWEAIFEKKEYEDWLDTKGFLVGNDQGEDAVIGGSELEEIATIYASMGGDGEAPVTFHYRQEVTPEGEIAVVPTPGIEDEQSRGTTQVIAPVPMRTLLENGLFDTYEYDQPRIQEVLTIGGVKVYDQVLPVDAYTFVPIYNTFNGNPYPSDDVDDVRNIQESLNFTQQKIARHLASSAGHVVMVARGTIDESELNHKLNRPGTNVVYYDPDDDLPGGGVIHLQVPPLNSEVYLEIDRKIAMIERIIGVYEFQQGQASNAPETFRGTIAQDEFAQRRIKSDLDNIEAGLAEAGRIAIQLVQAYWTTEKTFRVINPATQELSEFAINEIQYDDYSAQIKKINDVTVGTYDVRVIAGSTMPSNRFAQQDYYQGLYQLGLIDQVEFLKKAEVFDIEGILRRSGEIQQLRGYVEQLEQQIKDLNGDMQTSDREVRHLTNRVEAEKFKGSLNKLKNQIEAEDRVDRMRREFALRGLNNKTKDSNG